MIERLDLENLQTGNALAFADFVNEMDFEYYSSFVQQAQSDTAADSLLPVILMEDSAEGNFKDGSLLSGAGSPVAALDNVVFGDAEPGDQPENAGEEDHRRTEEDNRRSEQRERQYRHGLVNDCRSRSMELDGTETAEQLENRLDEYSRKMRLLEQVGVNPVSLVDERQVNAQWQRYTRAREIARLAELPIADHTPLTVIEAVNRGEYANQTARLNAFAQLLAEHHGAHPYEAAGRLSDSRLLHVEHSSETLESAEVQTGIQTAADRQSSMIRQALGRRLQCYLTGETIDQRLQARVNERGAVEVTIDGEVFTTTREALRSNVQSAINDVLANENLPKEVRARAIALSNFINTGVPDLRGKTAVSAPAGTRQGPQTDFDALKEIVGASQRERLWSENHPSLLSAPPQSSKPPRKVRGGEPASRLPAPEAGAAESVVGQGSLKLEGHPLHNVEVVLVRTRGGERGAPVTINESFRRFTAFTNEGNLYVSAEHPNVVFKRLHPLAADGTPEARLLIATDMSLIAVEQHNQRSGKSGRTQDIPPDNNCTEVTYNQQTGKGGDAPMRGNLGQVLTELERRAVETMASNPEEARLMREFRAELQRNLTTTGTISRPHLMELDSLARKDGAPGRSGRLKVAIDALFAVLGVPR